jgi:hypothetical protein
MSTGIAPYLRAVLFLFLVGSAGMQTGCCQYYCYPQPGCGPVAAQAGVVRYGAVCEAPEGGTVVSQAPAKSRSSAIADAPRPRVVVSEPGGRLAGAGGWHRSDPENFATTRLEGTIDDESRNR